MMINYGYIEKRNFLMAVVSVKYLLSFLGQGLSRRRMTAERVVLSEE